MNAAITSERNPAWPLIFVTHAAAGLFFAYETAGALAPYLEDEMNFTSHQIGLLYSAYSIPAIASIFLIGYFNKRFGAPKCIVVLSFVVALGASLVAMAPNFPLMFAGQLIYGAGSSPMFLTSTLITGKWFGTDAVGKCKISIAMGFVFAWLRFLSFAALFLLPIISQHSNFRVSMWTSALVCWSSFVAACIFYAVDRVKKYSVKAIEGADDDDLELDTLGTDTKDTKEEEDSKFDTKETNTERKSLLAVSIKEGEPENANNDGNSAIMVATEMDETEGNSGEVKTSLVQSSESTTMDCKKETWIEVLVNAFRTMRGFPAAYWLVLLLMFIFISDLYTCTAFLTKFLYEQGIGELSGDPSEDTRQNIAGQAAAVTSLVCLGNVITSPICGWLSGSTGWRVKYLILGSINLVLIHSLFAFNETAPAFVLASALGLTQSIMDTNLWPCLIFTVPKKNYPFALSLVTLSYNIGLILFPTICGFLQDLTHTWLSVNVAFIVFSSSSFFLAIALKYVDLKNGSILDLPFIKKPAKT